MVKAIHLFETDFDGEVEDYAVLITAPLTYSWTPTTSLNDPTLLNPNCSAQIAQDTIEVSTNNGCTLTGNNLNFKTLRLSPVHRRTETLVK